MEQKGTIVIRPSDVPIYVLGCWLVPLVASFIDVSFAKMCAAGALGVTIEFVLMYSVSRWL